MNLPQKAVSAVRERIMPCFVLLALLGCAAEAHAQGTTPQRGFNPGGSYALSDIESVNTTNGNVGLQIPIASLPMGRGGFPGAGLKLIYNSKVWDTPVTIVPDGTFDNFGQPRGIPKHYLKAGSEGGWRYAAGYEVRLVNRLDNYTYSPLAPSCETQWGTTSHDADYIYKVQVIFPDGSAHEFAPQGYQAVNNTTGDGYYNIRPDGYLVACSCHEVWGSPRPSCASPMPAVLSNAGTMTYYSTDGTYMRLDVTHDSDTNQWNNPWTISVPDGTRVVGSGFTGVGSSLLSGYPGSERIYDRNNNYVDIQITFDLISIADQLNRTITVNRNASPGVDNITTTGFGGAPLTWAVHWANTYVRKSFNSADVYAGCNVTTGCTSGVGQSLRVVESIDLPAQAGGLFYSFGYNGSPLSNNESTSPSPGWGELSSVTLPSGASVAYTYRQDNCDNIYWDEVLQNHPTSKTLTYLQEYDGSSSQAADVWSYSFNFTDRGMSISTLTTVTAPDGGVTSDYIKNSGASVPLFDDGLSYRTVRPDGTVVERMWAANTPYGHFGPAKNAYVKTEFTSIRNAAGNLTKTTIKDYDYDKNGNLTRVSEYDWVAYTDVPRTNPGFGITGTPTGLPPGVQPNRVTLNTYYAPTQNASDATLVDSPNSYSKGTSPRLRDVVASAEVNGDIGSTLSRAEFYYDDPLTTANLTEQRGWDSIKGGLARPLSAGTYISVFNEYDAYGNCTLTTDARGSRSQMTYGTIGTFSDIYPTQMKAALGTTIERTTSQEYDIYSGVITRVTDEDNHVSTSTIYDDFGRPTSVEEADNLVDANNVSIERRTVTEYSDALGRIIMRSDLNTTGDGKLVSVQHYDQLGRVRLSRTLEDSSASIGAAEDENVGIKVQSRYLIDRVTHASYQLTSNPYRAAHSSDAGAESTMGWTLTVSDQGGRVIRMETFDGAGLPSPFAATNTNTSSTGAVVTAYDAESKTVTDQAGKQRRSMSDGLGRLAKVFEAPNDAGYNYQTSYSYDANNNLTKVSQGVQTRTFNYSSLSRLTSMKHPESGTIEYQYDAGGNLVLKIDPRPKPGSLTLPNCAIPYTGSQIATCYEYDPLSRIKARSYNDGTPNVTYTYDASGANSKGRLSSVGSGASTYSYTAYDALGRVKSATQTTDGVPYTMPDYQYNLGGALTSEQYPSGRVVKTVYDAAGRVAGVKNEATNLFYVGASATDSANRIQYAASGALVKLKLGNGLWEHVEYNSRLQPTQIVLDTLTADPSTLRLDYTYGTDNSHNNGNVRTQTISVPGMAQPYVQAYGYDELNRLKSAEEVNDQISAAMPTWKQVNFYDRFGNRTFTTGTTTPGSLNESNNPSIDQTINRISSAGYAYDNAGNLSCDPGHPCDAAPDNAPYYRYDADNMLTNVGGGPESGGASYTYDGQGRRVKRVVGTSVTVLVYDIAGRIVAEYSNEQALPQATYTSYMTHDHLGSVRVVTGQNKEVKVRNDYRPFGEEVSEGRSGYGGGSVRQKFNSKERDAETGLDYFGARYYSSGHGRFTTCDPAGVSEENIVNPQRWNLYVFVINNPLTLVDPDGRKDEGSNGAKQIDIYLAYEGSDAAAYKEQRFKDDGNVHVYGWDESTAANVLNSLAQKDRTVIIVGHAIAASVNGRRRAGMGIGLRDAVLMGDGLIYTIYNGHVSYDVDSSKEPTTDFKINAKNFFFFGCRLDASVLSFIKGKMNGGTFLYSDGGPDGITKQGTDENAAEAAARAVLDGKGPMRASQKAYNESKLPNDGDRMRRILTTIRRELERSPERTPLCMGCGKQPGSEFNKDKLIQR